MIFFYGFFVLFLFTFMFCLAFFLLLFSFSFFTSTALRGTVLQKGIKRWILTQKKNNYKENKDFLFIFSFVIAEAVTQTPATMRD